MNNDTSWAGRHDSPIDRAIDRAVREIVQVDPPVGLRRRVLSRLASAPQRRASTVPWYAWGTAMVAVAILVVVLARDRSPQPTTAGQVPAQAADVKAPAPERAAELPTVTSTPVAPDRGALPRVTREAIRMPRVQNVFGAPSPVVAAADATLGDPTQPGSDAGPEKTPSGVPPLVVPPLAPSPIETPAIVIQPLVVAAPKGGR
jgi:hypothetical protein